MFSESVSEAMGAQLLREGLKKGKDLLKNLRQGSAEISNKNQQKHQGTG